MGYDGWEDYEVREITWTTKEDNPCKDKTMDIATCPECVVAGEVPTYCSTCSRCLWDKIKEDTVEKTQPDYYSSDSTLDVLDVIAMFQMGFHEGNVFKYVVRWRKKNGLEDLKKAREYLDRLICSQEKHIKPY